MIHVISHPGYRHDRAAREEEASTKRLLSAGPPVPRRQMVQWYISALGQRRLVAGVGLRLGRAATAAGLYRN